MSQPPQQSGRKSAGFSTAGMPPDLGGFLPTSRVPACSLELPEDKAKGKAARTLRLAVCQ